MRATHGWHGDTTVQYVWSPVYVDSMILRDRDADANTSNGFESRGLEERIYVLHDANYNVTALVDTDGDVLERYYYEAYGQAVYLDDAFALLPDAQSDHGWQHLHQGGRLDSATGNYHFRHRDLSPTLGRWISKDPIGFEGSQWNLYEYVDANPLLGLDPLGQSNLWNPFTWGDGGNNSWSEFLNPLEGYQGFGGSYSDFVNPWNGNDTPPVDWLDSALTGGTMLGQGTAVVAGALAGGVYLWGAAGGSTFGAGLITTSETSVVFMVDSATFMGTSSGVVSVPTGYFTLGYWTTITGIPILSAESAIAGASGSLWLSNHPCVSRAIQALAGGWL